MAYGFRNEGDDAEFLTFVNPRTSGAYLLDYNMDEGIVKDPTNVTQTGSILVGQGGIGVAPEWEPHVDVRRLFAMRRGNGLTLVNGLNSNIAAQTNSVQNIAGPTGAFSIGGIAPTKTDGQILHLVNLTVQDMTIVHADGSTTDATHRFLCKGGVDYTVTGIYGSVTLYYDGAVTRWVIIGTNNL